MNLPNYFLADLPPEAAMNPGMIAEACQTLKRNRARFLEERTTERIIHILAENARRWMDPGDPFRQLALAQGPAETGCSVATLEHGIDDFFSEMTRENLEALVMQELGHHHRLDKPVSSPEERETHRASLARGPELLVHIASGNIPAPAWTSIALGLLARSAQLMKCATNATLLPRLYAHSLYDAEPKLGACLEMASWPGGSAELEEVLFAQADCVTATGSDETLASIRRCLPIRCRFVGYGHRVSFGYISHKALSHESINGVVERAATDVIAWNQLGCLSPHVFYVQDGSGHMGEKFAEKLAVELARRETIEPRGQISIQASAAIASRRAFYEIRAAHSPETRHWFSPESTAWSVVYEADPQFQKSCLHRFIYVKGVPDLAEALKGAELVREYISTVGLGVTADENKELVPQLARWGVPRICPLGRMQHPPLGWRHDGRPALADLITWTDWEHET
jgi:hypothetical protein